VIDRFRAVWGNLGGKLGLGFCLAGFVAIFLGWNGAASFDRVPAQFPWLISGGVTGLALVVIGSALLVVENNRRDRAALMALLEELRFQMEHTSTASASGNGFAAPTQTVKALGGDLVVAGASSYHDPECRLVADRPDLDVISRADAEERDLTACRICNPAKAGRKESFSRPKSKRTASRR
jgi:hypothetical protein